MADPITSTNSTNKRNTLQNWEENTQNAVTPDTLCDSDMVTGVTANQQTSPHRPPPTRYPQSSIHDIDDTVTEIHPLGEPISDNVTQSKILQIKIPLLRGKREKYNEFEHLLLNHLRPNQHRLTEEQILTYFQSLLRDDATKVWQRLKINTQTTLAHVLRYLKKEEDLKEVVKYKFQQTRYDPTTETFNYFLNKYKKVLKRAFGERSADITKTFLFVKLPVQMQNELAIAGNTMRQPRKSRRLF